MRKRKQHKQMVQKTNRGKIMDKNNFHFKIRDMSKHELIGLIERYNKYLKEHDTAILAVDKFLEHEGIMKGIKK